MRLLLSQVFFMPIRKSKKASTSAGERRKSAARKLRQVAPALAQVGLAADLVIYVDACDEKSVLACFEEGVRHGGLGAVIAEVARLSMTSSRRLSLAAKASGSIAIAVTLQPREKTMTDEEIDAVGAKIVAEITKKTGGTLRA